MGGNMIDTDLVNKINENREEMFKNFDNRLESEKQEKNRHFLEGGVLG